VKGERKKSEKIQKREGEEVKTKRKDSGRRAKRE
jgi:hypothetical protein